MAESVEQLTSGDKFQTVVRRKLERFRAKLAELFFSSSTTTSLKRDNAHHIDIVCTDMPNNNSMLISNYYYGYTTSPVNEHNSRRVVKTSRLRQTRVEQVDNTSSSCTSSSSMIVEDTEVSQPVGVITLTRPVDQATFNTDLNADYSNYDTSSLNTNEEEDSLLRNPFLNKKLTDQIHFNADLALLHSYFETSLDSIDDQDNLFNMDFMINYISYILLKQIHSGRPQLRLTSVRSGANPLKEIAEQIFLDSACEPCGLKGCRMTIYLQTMDADSQLVTKFRFDTTSSITSFELNLTLKQVEPSAANITGGQNSFTTLTRRLFSANSSSRNPKPNSKLICIDGAAYELNKVIIY